MHSYGRSPRAVAGAAILVLLLSACSTTASDGGGSAPVSGSSGGSGQERSPSNSPANEPPGQPAPAQPPPQPPGPPAPAQPPPQPPGPPAPGQPPAPENVVLDWLPIGPVGRGDPIWYVRLKDLNCESIPAFSEPFNTVEEAARTLCLGLKGDRLAWDAGVSALQTAPTDCWSQAAHEILSNIAAVRKHNPNAIVKLAPRPGTACLPELTDLQDDEGNTQPSFVCAGDVIILDGNVTGLPTGSVRSVFVGTATAPVLQRQSVIDSNHPLEFYFLAPPFEPGQLTTAEVSIADADWPVNGSASFDYATDQSICLKAPGTAP